MRLYRIAFLGLLAVGAAAMSSPTRAQAPIVMKIGTATINDAQHEWMKLFAADLEKNSGGRIKVEIYPASQLGTSPRMIEQTQLNSIQGVVGPPEFLTGVDSRYQILSAPSLFKDLPHANRTLQDPAFNKAFLDLGANKGLMGLGLMISGPTVFVTRKPVTKLADFDGLKVRVLAAPLQLEQIRAMKMAPVPMPLGEVMPALQQGALDGVMSCVPVFVALKYADAAKYMMETNQGLITALTVISKTWFDNLPKDLQEAVVNAGKKASVDVYQFSIDDVSNGREKWKAAGGQLAKLSDAEQQQLNEQLADVGARVTEKNAAEKAMFETLRAAAERTK
jgi:TRAP-type C4-dicarboxylate transport system substrate-binding protein